MIENNRNQKLIERERKRWEIADKNDKFKYSDNVWSNGHRFEMQLTLLCDCKWWTWHSFASPCPHSTNTFRRHSMRTSAVPTQPHVVQWIGPIRFCQSMSSILAENENGISQNAGMTKCQTKSNILLYIPSACWTT